MLVSLGDFIKDCPEIRNLYGFSVFLQEYNSRRSKMEHGMIASKLLSNAYGTACDDTLCLAFRKYARQHTTFEKEAR